MDGIVSQSRPLDKICSAMSKETDLVSNRKAFHDYEILETFEAGMILIGTEVKSLRAHGGSLQDAYVIVSAGAVILKNSSIAPLPQAAMFNHEERRDRKLLLHKREIAKLERLTQEKGLAIIPLAIYLKSGYIKIKIAVAKGKKSYDKRVALKEKQQERDVRRAMQND